MRNLHLILPVAQFAKPVTERELSVATLAILPTKNIAHELKISTRTVEAHIGRIKLKTGLETRAAIAVWADRQTRRAA